MNDQSLKVLVVGESEAARVGQLLGHDEFLVSTEPTCAGARATIERESPACVLLGSDLSAADQLELLSFCVARQIPVIIISSASEAALEHKALQLGAQDYLPKDELSSTLLRRVVRHAVQRQHAESQFRTVLESSPVGTLVTDLDGRVVFANHAVGAMLDYGPGEMIGRLVEDFIPERFRHHHPEVRREYVDNPDHPVTTFVRRRLTALSRHGEEIPIELGLRRVRWRDQAAVLSHLLDLREIERLQATERERDRQLYAAQRMEVVGQVAGGVAHDFNNLLTVISTYGSLLLADMPPGSQGHEDLSEMMHAADRAAELTAQLLAFSRRRHVSPRTMDLNRTLATQESILARVLGEDISLKMRLDPKLWSITFDPAAFEQVLLNLTMNARDAIPGSGSVRVETDNFVVEEPSSFGAGPQLSPGNYVRLTILDDGEGIDPAILDRVFDPFFTTKPGGRGTGLGLATCYGLIRQANGFIDVQSSPGTGTIVEVLLPASSAPTQTATPERATGGRRGSETVLVVEDDDQVRKVAIMVLRARGYDVLEAADGTHALQICSERGNQIDALLTDVIMPGMSGRVLVEQIGQHWQHIRVLFMSGYTADAIIPRGGAGEGIALLSKPFTPASLTKKLREVLDSEEYRADIVAERLTSS